jgi:predicted NUDIX family phosphoesterase
MRYRGRYLLMRRTQGGGETRLRDRYTLGVGGHINPEDVGENPVLDGLRPGWPGRNLAAGRRWWRTG